MFFIFMLRYHREQFQPQEGSFPVQKLEQVLKNWANEAQKTQFALQSVTEKSTWSGQSLRYLRLIVLNKQMTSCLQIKRFIISIFRGLTMLNLKPGLIQFL